MRRVVRRHLSGRLAMILVLVASIALCALGACAPEDEWDYPVIVSEPYFDQGGFSQTNGRVTYTRGSLVVDKTGVDISDHQGHVDWDAVAGDGISFVFVRAGYRGNTEGYLHADTQFEQNLSGAQAAGLACGVYFYSQALNEQEAREEALFTLDMIGSRPLEYPVVFDFEPNNEGRLSSIDGVTATACARTFCETIRDAGYEVMLYGNAYDLQYLDLTQLSDYPIWFAQYTSAPSRTEAFTIWQYTNAGYVSGIDGPTDLSLDLSEAL